jgi:hypothetical protein
MAWGTDRQHWQPEFSGDSCHHAGELWRVIIVDFWVTYPFPTGPKAGARG